MPDLNFNHQPSRIMHIDLNSCFASVEQQANPFLRGKPIAIAAYDSPGGCILAPSIEAKTFGVKTGMRVRDGKILCPSLKILTNDPDKYRFVHQSLEKVLGNYTYELLPKSVDEFVLDFHTQPKKNLFELGQKIKSDIKLLVGDWLTVSIGIGPNRFLAKTASNLHKPDGLDEINYKNFMSVYKHLTLTDLTGINIANQARLNSVGIKSVLDFYHSPSSHIKVAFQSVSAHYWYLRLRGHEIDSVSFSRKSFGNSYALPKQMPLEPILMHITQKATSRMLANGYKCRGISVSTGYWHQSKTYSQDLFDWRDIYGYALKILKLHPEHSSRAKILSVSCFALTKNNSSQLDLFKDIPKKLNLIHSVNSINKSWGDFTIKTGASLKLESIIHDRIAFGQ